MYSRDTRVVRCVENESEEEREQKKKWLRPNWEIRRVTHCNCCHANSGQACKPNFCCRCVLPLPPDVTNVARPFSHIVLVFEDYYQMRGLGRLPTEEGHLRYYLPFTLLPNFLTYYCSNSSKYTMEASALHTLPIISTLAPPPISTSLCYPPMIYQ